MYWIEIAFKIMSANFKVYHFQKVSIICIKECVNIPRCSIKKEGINKQTHVKKFSATCITTCYKMILQEFLMTKHRKEHFC